MNLAKAEADAIRQMSIWLASEEGQAAGDAEVGQWMVDRGWHPSKWRAWAERIAAEQALADPLASDPTLIHAKLNHRFERLALKAEGNNDIKHAIEATKAQATLCKVGGFAPGPTTAVQVNVTNGTAHLVSDDDLIALATKSATKSATKIDAAAEEEIDLAS